MRFNTLEQWLRWQEKSHFGGIKLGIDRCAQVAKNMNLLEPKFTVVSVAGTNGKSSTVTMIESILVNSFYKTGSYTSPHLINYNERIKISGVDVSDDMLCQSFERVDKARGDISLTYFEFGTLAAFDIFHHENVEIALLEVGLGGRLDAVNILDADVALISSIGLDHTEWLGNDLEAIAREKAGIFRQSKPAIYSAIDPPKSILQYAKDVGAKIYFSGVDFSYTLFDSNWSWRYGSAVYECLPKPSYHNRCQVQNAAGVLMVLHQLKPKFQISEESIITGLKNFHLNGRFQILQRGGQIIFDVAHNTQAAKMLAYNLQQLPNDGYTHIIIGMLKDKDQRGVLSELCGIANYWHTVNLPTSRGSDGLVLKQLLLELGTTAPISESDTIADALVKLQHKAGVNDRVVITGSFISVSEAIRYFGC